MAFLEQNRLKPFVFDFLYELMLLAQFLHLSF